MGGDKKKRKPHGGPEHEQQSCSVSVCSKRRPPLIHYTVVTILYLPLISRKSEAKLSPFPLPATGGPAARRKAASFDFMSVKKLPCSWERPSPTTAHFHMKNASNKSEN